MKAQKEKEKAMLMPNKDRVRTKGKSLIQSRKEEYQIEKKPMKRTYSPKEEEKVSHRGLRDRMEKPIEQRFGPIQAQLNRGLKANKNVNLYNHMQSGFNDSSSS